MATTAGWVPTRVSSTSLPRKVVPRIPSCTKSSWRASRPFDDVAVGSGVAAWFPEHRLAQVVVVAAQAVVDREMLMRRPWSRTPTSTPNSGRLLPHPAGTLPPNAHGRADRGELRAPPRFRRDGCAVVFQESGQHHAGPARRARFVQA